MGGIGVLLALALVYADRKLYVYEDPRIDQVDAMLPHANCGACGCVGCRMFAEKLVAGEIAPGKCTVSSPQEVAAIAAFLQVDAGTEEKRVARLACAGGAHVARSRARYSGVETCRAAALVAGGGKACAWGCLGLGDCARACDFDAIHLDVHGLPVVTEALCTACGDCVEVCPKNLFSIRPVSYRLWVACSNLLAADDAEACCEVACTGCGRCAADAPGLVAHRTQPGGDRLFEKFRRDAQADRALSDRRDRLDRRKARTGEGSGSEDNHPQVRRSRWRSWSCRSVKEQGTREHSPEVQISGNARGDGRQHGRHHVRARVDRCGRRLPHHAVDADGRVLGGGIGQWSHQYLRASADFHRAGRRARGGGRDRRGFR